MSPHEQDERLRVLMAGFATGRLAEAEQAELLALLQDPAHGAARAREAWVVLDTVAALRAADPGLFLDQVVMRLHGSQDQTARAVAERIGRPRERLRPVPPPSARPRRAWLAVAALAGLTAAGLFLWLALVRHEIATVIGTTGVALSLPGGAEDGRPLIIGDRLAPGAVLLRAADAWAGLRLDDGSVIDLHGPRLHVLLDRRQCSLFTGRLRATAAGDLLIGWEGGSLRLAAGDAVELRLDSTASLIQVLSGAPVVQDLAGRRERLAAGATRAWSGNP